MWPGYGASGRTGRLWTMTNWVALYVSTTRRASFESLMCPAGWSTSSSILYYEEDQPSRREWMKEEQNICWTYSGSNMNSEDRSLYLIYSFKCIDCLPKHALLPIIISLYFFLPTNLIYYISFLVVFNTGVLNCFLSWCSVNLLIMETFKEKGNMPFHFLADSWWRRSTPLSCLYTKYS